MTKLQCRVPPAIAEKIRHKTAQAGTSLSCYLADLLKRDSCAGAGWPEGYFDTFGRREGAHLSAHRKAIPKLANPSN